jgi:hypothetical protein
LTLFFNRIKILIMVRTQIQLPEVLYKEVQRVARSQEWSIAEVIRRGAESVVRAYPAIKPDATGAWTFPPPIHALMLVQDAASLRDMVHEDAEAR